MMVMMKRGSAITMYMHVLMHEKTYEIECVVQSCYVYLGDYDE